MKPYGKLDKSLAVIACIGMGLAACSVFFVPQYTVFISFGVLVALGAVEHVVTNYTFTIAKKAR